jgi:cytochrome c oxidase cbb3-type subunit 3
LTDDIWLHGGTPDLITQTVNLGRNGKMPAHKTLLNEDRQRLLAAYVISLSAAHEE